MNAPFREFVVGGILVAPLFFYALAALFLILLIRPLLHRVGFPSYFSNPPIAELSLYVTIFGLLTLLR